MRDRERIAAIAMVTLALSVGVCAAEEAKYPDWTGQWQRFAVKLPTQPSHDQTKPWGLGQQAPLTPEYETIHLRNMITLQRAFDCPVGFSDHTLGTAIPLAAIALGACIIEKHFTLDQEMAGWDHAISANPEQMRTIVREGRNIIAALGSGRRTVSDAEMEKRKKFRRSLVARQALGKGHVLSESDFDAKRPGTGVSPDEIQYVVGRTLADDLAEDQVIRWSHLQ